MPDAEVPTPTLMRAARGAYARAIRAHLLDAGIDELPRNAAAVLAVAAREGSAADPGRSSGVTDPAIDRLVAEGYVERGTGGADAPLGLTERGATAFAAIVAGADAVDAELRDRLGADGYAALRAGLVAMAEVKVAGTERGAGVARPKRQVRQWQPIFPVRDLAAALDHYTALGFATSSHDEGYGFANREGTGLHLSVGGGAPAAAYLHVRDADVLAAEWSRPGVGGTTRPVVPMPWGLREGSHTDPDGNLIRFGSPLD